MKVLYNENDPYVVEWLTRLSSKKFIASGEIDSRSIVDLKPKDLKGFTQAHFFAGIGVWSYALKLAGWPSTVPVWTGSCPCQPFSTAGRRKGEADARHLWPVWFQLIRKCRPPIIFGEQVASPAGRQWLDAVYADLEGAGYAVGASDLCAAGVGAPHIRQRLYFMAISREQRREGKRIHLRPRESRPKKFEATWRSKAASLEAAELFGATGCVGDPSTVKGFWREAQWWIGQDGKVRPAEPGSFPLVDGAPARMGRLRAYGNAIVPQVAATFIRASVAACNGL